MFNRSAICLIAIVLCAGLLLAHGDPILGTVTAVKDDSFTITGKDNKAVTIMLEKSTKYLMNDKPAKKADLRTGDIVLSVAGKDVRDLAGFFRRIWAQGQAGVEVPITIYRDGETMDVRVKSSERNRFLKGPSLH